MPSCPNCDNTHGRVSNPVVGGKSPAFARQIHTDEFESVTTT